MAAAAPLQELFDILLEKLRICIFDGCVDEIRDHYANLLHNYAILNLESAEIVRKEPSFAPIIWYERVRMQKLFLNTSEGLLPSGPIGFFLEGLPRGMPLFGAPVALELPVSKCRQLVVRDITDERSKTVTKLDTMSDPARLQGLADQLDSLPDLTVTVPQRVRLFVSRMRSLCNGIRASRNPTEFVQCKNQNCNRLFFKGPEEATWENTTEIRACYQPGVTPSEFLDVSLCDPRTADDNTNYYWSECGTIPDYNDALKRFCCSACCFEWRHQLNRCIPTGIEFDNEKQIRRSGFNRIQSAFDAALKRNCEFDRKLNEKSAKRARRKAKAVGADQVQNELDSRIDMMNIDLGVLYWSTLMSGCPENIYNRSLPGDRPGWRSDSDHRIIVRTISMLYTEINTGNTLRAVLITNMLKLPRFFSAIKTRSARLL